MIVLLLSCIFMVNVLGAEFVPKSFTMKLEKTQKTLRGKEKTYPIEIKYLYRGHIIYEVFGDQSVKYICNPHKVWIYNPPFIEGESGELKIGKSSKYCYSKIFDTLSNGLKDNKYYSVSIQDNSADILFKESTSKQLSIMKMTLKFNNKKMTFDHLSEISFFKLGDNEKNTLRIKSISKDIKLEPSEFEFNIPDNTNIQRMD